MHRRSDAHDNEVSRLPADESVALSCVWVTEAYLPSHVPKLLRGLERLGWLRPNDIFGNNGLDEWLSQARHRPSGGATINLGAVHREDETATVGHIFRSDLRAPFPGGIKYAEVQLVQPVPSLTVLVIQFMLGQEAAAGLEPPLRADYRTDLDASSNGGWVVHDSPDIRRQEALVVRLGLRDACAQFVADFLPGFFAEEQDLRVFPTADLLTVAQHPLASDAENPLSRPSFIDVLDLRPHFDAYISTKLPGLFILPERGRYDVGRHLTFTGTQRELLASEDFKSVDGLAVRLRFESDVLVLWTIRTMVYDLGADLAKLRDVVGNLAGSDDAPAIQAIREVERELATIAGDFMPLLADLEDDFVVAVLAKDARGFTAYDKRYADGDFGEHTADRLKQCARQASRAYADVRLAAQSLGTLAAAQASEDATSASLALQRITLWLAVVSTVVALLALGQAVMQWRR